MTVDVPADVRDMYMVHTAFRREFRLLPGLVRAVAAGDVERARVVAGHAALLDGTLHHHHGMEDRHLWPLLLERVPDELEPLVHTMEGQHEGIDKLGVEVRASLDAWRENADPQTRERLASAFEKLIPALEEHLGMEEQQVLPLMEKHISQAEWSAMVQEGAASANPGDVPLMLGLMMYEGDPEVVDATIGQLPPEIQPVIREAAWNAFQAHSELVHGTTTPRRSTEW